MRDRLASVLAMGVALSAALAGQSAMASANVNSDSNADNNRIIFNTTCSNAGGRVSITDRRSVCVLPSIAVTGEGVRDRLRAACVNSGGRVGQHSAAPACLAG